MAAELFPRGEVWRGDPHSWLEQTVVRIEALPDSQVLLELQQVMKGQNYSWHSINKLLQDRLDTGDIELTHTDGDVIFEWNNLCDEKRIWEKKGKFSHESSEFNRDCLINLMILPFLGGLGFECLSLVVTNLDKPNRLIGDLWVAHASQELRIFMDGDTESTDDDDLSWSVEESDEELDENASDKSTEYGEFQGCIKDEEIEVEASDEDDEDDGESEDDEEFQEDNDSQDEDYQDDDEIEG